MLELWALALWAQGSSAAGLPARGLLARGLLAQGLWAEGTEGRHPRDKNLPHLARGSGTSMCSRSPEMELSSPKSTAGFLS